MAFFHWHKQGTTMELPPPWVAIPSPLASTVPTRRYLGGKVYPLPKDQGEKERLEYQHYALNLALGNEYLAPLPPQARVIVDVGTGTGIWACEMARLFPSSLVLGLDVDAALFRMTPPANCLLRVGDVLSRLPLPDQVADLTHQRFLVLAIPDARWPGVVRELVRVTRPGGWIELVETDGRVQAGGPATARVFAWLDTLRTARGLQGKQVLHLGELLRREGVGEIEERAIRLKVGAWGGRAGQMMKRDILAAVQSLKEPCCAQGVEAHVFDDGVKAMAAEWQQAEVFCMVHVAYGRRMAP